MILYRDGDPRELGIEDEKGNWDLVKFREHIRSCPLCKRFYFLLGEPFIDRMIEGHGRFWTF